MTKLNLADPDDRAIIKYSRDLGRAGTLNVDDAPDPEPPSKPMTAAARQRLVGALAALVLADMRGPT